MKKVPIQITGETRKGFNKLPGRRQITFQISQERLPLPSPLH